MKKRIGIIGATGSIGKQSADVIINNPELFDVVFVSAYSDANSLSEIAATLNAETSILMSEPDAEKRLEEALDSSRLDLVLNAASGIGALKSVYMVAQKGIDMALANKESIVTAGTLIMETAEASGCKIIPVDSEHSAIFQCLKSDKRMAVHKVSITASGGPFRKRAKDTFGSITVDEALNHPKWAMGKKISIDSATMMNKGLELIEARYLFDMKADKLEVLVHPESIIHSLVTFTDGSTIAQMANADMRVPISFALGFPDRITSNVKKLDLTNISTLTFEKPDLERFPCLKIAIEVLISDSNAKMAALNASNELAVSAFLEHRIRFTDIAKVVEETLAKSDNKEAMSIDEALENNAKSLAVAEKIINKIER